MLILYRVLEVVWRISLSSENIKKKMKERKKKEVSTYFLTRQVLKVLISLSLSLSLLKNYVKFIQKVIIAFWRFGRMSD